MSSPQPQCISQLDGFWAEFKIRGGAKPHPADVLPDGCSIHDVVIMQEFSPAFCEIYGNRYLFHRILQLQVMYSSLPRDAVLFLEREIRDQVVGRFLVAQEFGEPFRAPQDIVHKFLNLAFCIGSKPPPGYNVEPQHSGDGGLDIGDNDTGRLETWRCLECWTVHSPHQQWCEFCGVEQEPRPSGHDTKSTAFHRDECSTTAIAPEFESILHETEDEDTSATVQSNTTLKVYKFEVVCAALKNFEDFRFRAPGTATLEQVEASSQGVEGWADAGSQIASLHFQDSSITAKVVAGMSLQGQLDFRRAVYHTTSSSDTDVPLWEKDFLTELVERGQRHRLGDWLPEGCRETDVCMMRFTARAAKVYGNRLFYSRVWFRRKLFEYANDADREQELVESVINVIHKEGGRFMYEDLRFDTFDEAPLRWAEAHVRQAFGIANSSQMPAGWVVPSAKYARHTIDNKQTRLRPVDKSPPKHRGSANIQEPSSLAYRGDKTSAVTNSGDDFMDGGMIRSEITGELYEIDFVMAALRNYESFNGLKVGTATLAEVEATSAGVEGWAFTILNNEKPEVNQREDKSNDDEQDTKPAANTETSHGHRRGDDEEKIALQMALLESVGVRPSQPEFYEDENGSCASYYQEEEQADVDAADDYSYEYEEEAVEEEEEEEEEEDDDDDDGRPKSGKDSKHDAIGLADEAKDGRSDENDKQENTVTCRESSLEEEALGDRPHSNSDEHSYETVEEQGGSSLIEGKVDEMSRNEVDKQEGTNGHRTQSKISPQGEEKEESKGNGSKTEEDEFEKIDDEQVERSACGSSTTEVEYVKFDEPEDIKEQIGEMPKGGEHDKTEPEGDSWRDSEEEEEYAQLLSGFEKL